MTVPKNIQLWLDALRSGDYKQCRTALENGSNSYCCLGVACKVAGSHGIDVRLENGMLVGMSLDSQSRVQKWLGLHHEDGVARPGSSLASLVTLNDDLGYSFAEIADHIEAHWPEYTTTENNNDNA